MPIRAELRHLYPDDWKEISRIVRFDRAGGRCERCGRPHLLPTRHLPDGRWFDDVTLTWRDMQNRPARWPDLTEAPTVRERRVVLAAAHLDGNPANNVRRNLKALCQRHHLERDRQQHRRQRWLTPRRRYAWADLFLGPYEELVVAFVTRAAAA